MPRAFSQHEKELINERLLEQGQRLFATFGLKKTNIEDLSRAAGISKGAFYLFYESKEALFMDVAEKAEERFRREVMKAIAMPGPTPRARLFAVFKKAFALWKTVPLLQVFTRSDFDVLARRIPVEKLDQHLAGDQAFIEELITRCQEAGIAIRAGAEEIRGLLYALFFTVLHEEDLGPERLEGAIDLLLEMTAAFCLGEVEVKGQSL